MGHFGCSHSGAWSILRQASTNFEFSQGLESGWSFWAFTCTELQNSGLQTQTWLEWSQKAVAGIPTLADTLTTIHDYHPRAFVMVNVDSSTPKLKVAKKWLDAFSSRDASRLGPLLSKSYKNHTFPSIYPEETKEEHIRRYEKMVVPMTGLEVRIQRWRTAFCRAD